MAETAAWLVDPAGKSTNLAPMRTRPMEVSAFRP
jgi:hypothetical protein